MNSPRPHSSASTARRLLAGLALAALGAAALPARAGDVAVSIGFSQPGVYGRVDIGRYPQPVLVAQQPVIIGQPVMREPVYLWVPPEHQRDWRHHCQRYGACGAPVYFVQDGWYRGHVHPHNERRDRDDRGWRGHDRRDDRRDDRREDRRDDRRDDWRDDHRDHRH